MALCGSVEPLIDQSHKSLCSLFQIGRKFGGQFLQGSNAAFAFSADPVAVCSWVLRMPVSLPVSTSFENAAETDNTPLVVAATCSTVCGAT